jgi:hypothetical protein
MTLCTPIILCIVSMYFNLDDDDMDGTNQNLNTVRKCFSSFPWTTLTSFAEWPTSSSNLMVRRADVPFMRIQLAHPKIGVKQKPQQYKNIYWQSMKMEWWCVDTLEVIDDVLLLPATEDVHDDL